LHLAVKVLLVPCVLTPFAQAQSKKLTLTLNRHVAELPVVDIKGRSYVEVSNLARALNGSVSFRGDLISLTVPGDTTGASAQPSEPEQTRTKLTPQFMKSAIEALALMREWGTTLAYSIKNGYPVTDQWVSSYREQARSGVQTASSSATTDDDRNAVQLLTNEFESVLQWTNKLLDARKSMSAANYALSDNALRNDPLSQKIMTCGHFLGTMLGSGQFGDDASCH